MLLSLQPGSRLHAAAAGSGLRSIGGLGAALLRAGRFKSTRPQPTGQDLLNHGFVKKKKPVGKGSNSFTNFQALVSALKRKVRALRMEDFPDGPCSRGPGPCERQPASAQACKNTVVPVRTSLELISLIRLFHSH